MMGRCYTPAHKSFAHYGGRGITVCERWRDFANFLADMGECPPGLTLDRKDNDGHYDPGNCRWATQKEQQNNRSITRFLEFNGQRRSMKEWADTLGINYQTLFSRVQGGWPVERILTEPVARRFRNRRFDHA